MKKLFNLYRPLAYIVGVLLIGVYVYSAFDIFGSTTDSFRHSLENYQWILEVHGVAFMIYAVVAFMLSRRAGWTLRFLVVLLLAGCIIGLIFWVERLVEERVRPWIAEEAAAAQMSSGSGAVSGS